MSEAHSDKQPSAPGTPASEPKVRSRQSSVASQSARPPTAQGSVSQPAPSQPIATSQPSQPLSPTTGTPGPTNLNLSTSKVSGQRSRPPSIPNAQSLTKTASGASLKEVASVTSIGRRASQGSVTGTAQPGEMSSVPPQEPSIVEEVSPEPEPEPVVEEAPPPPPAAPTYDPSNPDSMQQFIHYLEEQLADKEHALSQSQAKVASLEQTNASLQRLMQSTSQDAKVKLLTQDINKRSEKIKSLEAELKREKKRADEAEKAAKSARDLKRSSRSSMTALKSGDKDKDATIRDLQLRLANTEQKLAEVTSAAEHAHAMATAAGVDATELSPPPMPSSSGGSAESAVLVNKLRQMLTEREAEKQMLERRLERAQEAIVSSAGAGFENEVKLQQARAALQCILNNQGSPRSKSPSKSPRGYTDFTKFPSTGSRGLAQFDSVGSRGLSGYPSGSVGVTTYQDAGRLGSASPHLFTSPRNVSPMSRYAPAY